MFGISATALTAISIGTSVASIGMGVAGSMAQASAQRKAGVQSARNAGMQQAQSEYEAQEAIRQSQEKARVIRSEAVKARANQVATAAASGVMVGEGSTQSMVDEVTSLSEQDVVAILWDGANGYISSTEEGRMARMQGEFQAKQANTMANATLIQGFGSALGQVGGMMGKLKAGATTPTVDQFGANENGRIVRSVR